MDIQNLKPEDVKYEILQNETQLKQLIPMIDLELSEPYSIFTYRYFIQGWKELTYIAFHDNKMIGVVIGKLEIHKKSNRNRGYVAMIVVDKQYRGLRIGKKLAQLFIDACRDRGADEVVLETEAINKGALGLYKNLGFARVKRLMNYYLNGNDAFRLKLFLTEEKDVSISEDEQGQGNQPVTQAIDGENEQQNVEEFQSKKE